MLTTDTEQAATSRQDTAAASACADAEAAQPADGSHIDPELAAAIPQQGAQSGLSAELAMHRHVTLELQRAILPLHDEPFDLPGLRAMVRYLPASSATRVGGDWYITAELPDGRVLLAIGDVAGHGLPAAAGMARLRGALAGLSITGAPPQQLVGWLNDLVRHVDDEHTASVVAGYFDPASRMLTWAQAGHPPPVLIRGTWATPLPQPDGILLGAGRRGYAAATVQLEPGDLLLLYSDGLVERRDRAIDEGLEILLEAVRQSTDPDLVIGTALAALGSDAEDDTCLVALRVLEPARQTATLR
jgi:serine phosphatase RsbU (regulator of sigma subunit)